MESTDAFIVAVSCIYVLLLALSLVLIISFLKTRKQEKLRKQQEARLAYQEKLLHKTLLKQQEERTFIAQDIQGKLSSQLDVMYLYLNQLSRKTPEATESIEEMIDILTSSIDTSERICQDLLPSSLGNRGLNAAMVEMCEAFRKTHQVEIELEARGKQGSPEDKGIEIHAFRISRDR